MANKKIGKQTIAFTNPPVITGYASIVGKKEGQGPLNGTFDRINEDTNVRRDDMGKSGEPNAEGHA